MDSNWTWLLAVGVALAVGIAIYLSRRFEKARQQALHEAAGQLRLSFSPDGDAAFAPRLGAFGLFQEGHSKKLTSLMRGTVDDLEVAIFDYRYTTGGGKHSHTHRQTAQVLGFPGAGVPVFSLRPENVFHKIGGWFGSQDIDFDSRPEFSRAYLLRGPDEDAIRRLFTERVLAYFEAHPGLCLETDGNRLLVYRHDRRVAPEELRDFLALGRQTLEQVRPWRF
jgi:hypothetical protein